MTAAPHGGAFKALPFAGLVALAGFGVAAFLISGSYLFWQAEKKADVVSQRNLQELRGRLETAKRERADLQGSEETYKGLIARGAFVPERRLDFVEAMAELKRRHNLMGLEYEIAPQRPLKFAAGGNYSGVGIMASRVRMKIHAYHDGELVAFLDEFPRISRGFFPLDKCSIKRIAAAEQRAPAGDQRSVAADDAPPVSLPVLVALTPAIEADCTMEWITLIDKNKPANLQAMAETRKPL